MAGLGREVLAKDVGDSKIVERRVILLTVIVQSHPLHRLQILSISQLKPAHRLRHFNKQTSRSILAQVISRSST